MADEEKKPDIRALLRNRRAIRIAAILLLILIIALIAGLNRRRRESGSISLMESGTLTAAIVNGEDRYADRDGTGKLVGKEPEIAQTLADTLGLTCRILEASSEEEALEFLDQGKADVAFGRFPSDRDYTGYATSGEYDRCGLFCVTVQHDYTDSLTLMTGYTVGVMHSIRGTACGIKGYDFISPKDYTDPLAMGKDIRDRAVNMGICDERDALELVRAFPGELQTQEIADDTVERYVAVFPIRSATYATILDAVVGQR